MGFSLSSKDYGSDVYVKDLREGTQEHFKEGIIKVDDLDAAYRILDNYKQEAKDLKDAKSKSQSKDTNKDNSNKTQEQKKTS